MMGLNTLLVWLKIDTPRIHETEIAFIVYAENFPVHLKKTSSNFFKKKKRFNKCKCKSINCILLISTSCNLIFFVDS